MFFVYCSLSVIYKKRVKYVKVKIENIQIISTHS